MEPADLVTLVAQIHAAAVARGDEPIVTICEELGHRLIAEAAKEVMPDTVPEVSKSRELPEENNGELSGKEVMPSNPPEHKAEPPALVPAAPAADCPTCAKRAQAAREAQKRFRKKRKRKTNSKEKMIEKQDAL